jgi:hypothetical protein
MNEILIGAIAMASMVAGLFFLKFWRSTGDRFFLFFALSFFMEGLNRAILSPSSADNDGAPAYYLIRLVAYGLILYAILDKNRPEKGD